MVKICRDCGTVGEAVTVTKGSIFIELLLWLCFLVPGLIYSIWRLTSRYQACPKCGGTSMLPLGSPIGAHLAQQVGYVAPVIRPSPGAERFGQIVGRWFARK